MRLTNASWFVPTVTAFGRKPESKRKGKSKSIGVVTALVVGVVAAGAVAGSAAAKRSAAKKAAGAQKKALSEQESILRRKLDPGALNRLAIQFDTERATNRRKLQEQQDPELAKLRDMGKQQLLEEFSRPESSRQSNQVANQLFQENIEQDPRLEALKDSIISKAQEDFDRGASLPAEFQAELVRSGIAAGAGSGIGVSRNQVGGVTSRLLGGAGIQLEAQRVAEAQQLANTAQNLTASRASILSSIFPTVKAAEDAKLARAGAAFQIGESTMPQAGLSGADAINLEVSRRNAQIAARGQRGVINAQNAIARGEANAAYIQAAGQAASAGIGAYGSLAGAGAAGAGAGATQPMGVSQAAFGTQQVPMVGSAYGGANIQMNPYTGQMVDLGMPGYRTPQQIALFNQIQSQYQY